MCQNTPHQSSKPRNGECEGFDLLTRSVRTTVRMFNLFPRSAWEQQVGRFAFSVSAMKTQKRSEMAFLRGAWEREQTEDDGCDQRSRSAESSIPISTSRSRTVTGDGSASLCVSETWRTASGISQSRTLPSFPPVASR